MSDPAVLVQRDADIATVVLNRPEKLNALTRPMWQRLGEVFQQSNWELPEDVPADLSIRFADSRPATSQQIEPHVMRVIGKPLPRLFQSTIIMENCASHNRA